MILYLLILKIRDHNRIKVGVKRKKKIRKKIKKLKEEKNH